MILPLLMLSLAVTFQGGSSASAPDRLAQAESQHDRAAVIALLTELTDTLPTAPASALPSAIPPLVGTVADPDPRIRSLALLALTALTSRTASNGELSNDAVPLLEPFLPVLSQHLADPDPAVCQLTALFLGGFLTNPTPAVILPLLATLASPERPTAFDLSVVVALLTVGAESPTHPEIGRTILDFLHRRDLADPLRVRLVGAVANHPRHNAVLDAGLLSFLEPSQPPALRVSMIGLLPHLALSQAQFGETRARLEQMVASNSEDGTVRNAAAAVLPCWRSPRMADPCPSPAVHYRVLPQPAKPVVTSPRYRSPFP